MTFSGGAGKTGTRPVGSQPPGTFPNVKTAKRAETSAAEGPADIAPVARPVVALPLTFPTSSMVIDTGGRKLYYVLPDKKAYCVPDLGRPRGLRLDRY